MATNQTGIAIVIRAFLPTGKTVEEHHAALTMMMKAHETKDYSEVLKASDISDVKAEPKTRRIETDEPASDEPAAAPTDDSGLTDAFNAVEPAGPIDEPEPAKRRAK